MSITPDFLDEIRARIRVSDVVGRRVKLTRKGREFVGLSPFNNEKTPSFTVNDQKAFYHCFSSGKHGDIFKFLQEVEGLTFPEAVERLAEEAGLEVPRQSGRSKEAVEKQRSLLEVMELACAYFETSLQAPEGHSARHYLEGRRLAPKAWKTFRLGYAPDSRTGLMAYLSSQNVPADMVEQAGLLSKRDDGTHQDKFRNRIIFPIADNRGRVIAFGGRALEKDSKRPKYLNSPETPLFHKGRVLYNHHIARGAAHDAGRVVVAEGYMDVIALAEGGFPYAVAPLGTALTTDQLSLLWRMSPEPVLCFDGDRAGIKAAYRALDLALPMLKPGHSLKFALLPEGQDPDDIIGANGPDAMRQLLDQAKPLVETLWERELNAQDMSTPELRAGYEKRVSDLLNTIQDSRIRDHYRREFGHRWSALYPAATAQRGAPSTYRRNRDRPSFGANKWGRNGSNGGAPPSPSSALLKSALAKPSPVSTAFFENESQENAPQQAELRETALVVCLCNHPELLEWVEEEFAALDLRTAELDRLRGGILELAASSDGLEREGLITQLHKHGVGKIAERYLGKHVLGSVRFVNVDCSSEDALKGWQHVYAIHDKVRKVQVEHDGVVAELADGPTEDLFERWQLLRAELERLQNESFEEDPL